MTVAIGIIAALYFLIYGVLSWLGWRWVGLILALFGMPVLISLAVHVAVDGFHVPRDGVMMVLKYHLLFVAAAVLGWLAGWRFRR